MPLNKQRLKYALAVSLLLADIKSRLKVKLFNCTENQLFVSQNRHAFDCENFHDEKIENV